MRMVIYKIMDNKRQILFKIQEIDAIGGILTPHSRDISDIGKNKVDFFRTFTENDLLRICKIIDGKTEDLNQGENWAISKEFFLGVKIHILYQFYGDEFGIHGEDELQILFSGAYVHWISGEDLCHFTEILVNYIELIMKNQTFPQVYNGNPSDMLKIAIKERIKPFLLINKDDFLKISEFLGTTVKIPPKKTEISLDNVIKIICFPFPNYKIELLYPNSKNKQEVLDFHISGATIKQIPVYDSERLIIMTVNHCLRYIKQILKERAPAICNLMFSGFFRRKYPNLIYQNDLP